MTICPTAKQRMIDSKVPSELWTPTPWVSAERASCISCFPNGKKMRLERKFLNEVASLAHRCTLFLCHLDWEISQYVSKQESKDNLVGQLTTPVSQDQLFVKFCPSKVSPSIFGLDFCNERICPPKVLTRHTPEF